MLTNESNILRVLAEAEQLSLAPTANEAGTPGAAGTPISAVTSNLQNMANSQPQAPAGIPGMPGPADLSQFPSAAPVEFTTSKTVINRDVIKTKLSDLKTLITNYEKKFDGEDLTPEAATIHVNELVGTLKQYAVAFNSVLGGTPAESAPEAIPATPVSPEPEMGALDVAPEAPEPSISPMEGLDAPVEDIASPEDSLGSF